jgi:amino acid adenylation domain-containing protein
VSELPLVSEEEREQLLVEWNWREVEYESEGSLAERFEQVAAERAVAVGLVYEEEEVSYGELNRRSNQLAHYLRGQGVGPEVRVGLQLERSVEMVVGILGVLKAGGAYVPLDPSYPLERLRYMLEDSGATMLVTQQHLLAGLADDAGSMMSVRVLCLDSDGERIAGQPESNLSGEVSGANLAYVIYTSGSTGRPKGVMVTQGNVLRLLSATQERFRFGAEDVWTMFHSYAFDFSVWEMWGALLYGGRLVLVPYWVSRAPEAFYELLVKERVTVLNQTPSAFRQLQQAEEQALAGGRAEGELGLRVIIFGGEALEVGSLRGWYERHNERQPQLVNMYGITETTVHVTYRELGRADVERRGSVIGWRLPDLELYLLDERLEPVPVGVAGELYVGGAGLARGYLNQAELTAERFIPHPYSRAGGARLYRTGDQGRYLVDGDVEYLGRLDQQVKIRGFRIETGEIEAVLSGHEAVREAVVMAREDVAGEKRLVGYVVAQGGAADGELKISELRNYLRERLPEYMVPSYFVVLEALPLTANGKLDRGALPAPQLDGAELSAAYVAPRTPTEELLVGIWATVLGVERVGVEDNFFEVGGHSLLATQLISRIREAFAIEMPLRTLFERPTIAALAEDIETILWATQDMEVLVGPAAQDYEEGEV